MSSLLCHFPWWEDGRVSLCMERSYPVPLTPIVASAISLVFIVWPYCFDRREYQSRPRGFEPVAGHGDGEVEPSGVPTTQQCITAIHWHARILEDVCLVADLVVCTTTLIKGGERILAGTVLLSTWLLVSILCRHRDAELRGALQLHLERLYYAKWFCVSLTAHTEIVEQHEDLACFAILLRLIIYTGLVLIHWTAPRLPAHHEQESEAEVINVLTLARDETAST